MKVAVLGCGGMGTGVLNTVSKHPDVSDVIGMDINPERLDFMRKQRGFKATDNLDEIMNDPEVKLVFVTASNDAHAPLVRRAIEAGKAIMCEKPIANTLADAEELVSAAEAKGLFFQIGFELRYSKLYTTVKDFIDAGVLGQVVNTQCKYICSEFHHKGSWRNKLETGGSMFGEKLCHYVDLPRWWIGSDVVDVYSACAPNVVPYYEVHDNYHAIYRFANGAVSELTFVMYVGETFAGDPLQNVIDQQKEDGHELRYLVMGTKGAVETDVFRRSIKRWAFGDSEQCMTSKIVEQLTWPPEEDGRYFHDGKTQNLDIIDRVVRGKPPKTPARDALETMKLVFAAEQSADTHQVVKLAALAGVRA